MTRRYFQGHEIKVQG